MSDIIIAKVDQARMLLAQARDAGEAKHVADLAKAAEVYSKRQKLSEEAIAYATAVKVDAMTLMGEMLATAPKQAGARGVGPIGVPKENSNQPPTLADNGISKKESSDAQALAAIKKQAPELHEQVRAGAVPVSKAAVEFRRARANEEKRERLQEAALATKTNQPDWRIINAEVLDGLARIESGSVRLAFADPPYNQGVDYGDGASADTLSDEDYLGWCQSWMNEVVRCLAPDGSFWVLISDAYADYFGMALRAAGLHRKQWLIWYESFGVCDADKRGFARSSRHLLWCVKDPRSHVFNPEPVTRRSARETVYDDKRANPDGRTWDSVWGIDPPIPRLCGTAAERLPGFPTQLPLALVRPIVLCASNPGDLVCDPFNGSGATGVAAIESGRRYIGIEKSVRWHELATLRLKGALLCT